MKKILVISFSQTGQLDQIVDNFLVSFKDVDAEIDRVAIEPEIPFPFPWNTPAFYGVMPETVLEEPIKIKPIAFKHSEYDLIILGYQPWFLSPSMPTTSILQDEQFCKLIKDKPVVTILGARNMWLNAQESVKKMIKAAGGNLVANIPLVDKTPNLISVITIVYWMSTGKKNKKWGIFPKPGVSDEDINESHLFGKEVAGSFQNENYTELQNNILKLDKIKINTSILFIESRAKKLFNIWANIIKKKGTTPKKRNRWLTIYRCYLYFALFVVSPIVLTIYTILFRPFTPKSIRRKKDYFCSIKTS